MVDGGKIGFGTRKQFPEITYHPTGQKIEAGPVIRKIKQGDHFVVTTFS
jgi:hypothetical protein